MGFSLSNSLNFVVISSTHLASSMVSLGCVSFGEGVGLEEFSPLSSVVGCGSEDGEGIRPLNGGYFCFRREAFHILTIYVLPKVPSSFSQASSICSINQSTSLSSCNSPILSCISPKPK